MLRRKVGVDRWGTFVVVSGHKYRPISYNQSKDKIYKEWETEAIIKPNDNVYVEKQGATGFLKIRSGSYESFWGNKHLNQLYLKGEEKESSLKWENETPSLW